MRWKWILGAAVVLIVVLSVTIYVILSSYDFNDLKPMIVQTVKDATGRELTLGGDIKLDFGLTTALVVEDVSFQNIPWGSRSELAKIGRLEVQAAVLPLIDGILDVKRLILIEPDILIETNSAGKSNLEFKTTKEKEPKKSEREAPSHGRLTMSALAFNEIRIEKGRLTYQDGQSGRVYTVTLERATAAAGADDPVVLKLKGEYNYTPFRVKATLGPPVAFIDPDKAWPVKLTSNIAGSTVTIDGAVRDPIKGKGLAVTVTGTGRSIPEILKLFNITSVPELGPFDVTGKLTDLDGKLGVKDLDLNVGSPDTAIARFTGTVEDLIKGKGLAVTVTGKGRSIPEILKLFNITSVPELGPFDVTGKLTDLDGKLGVKDLDLNVGSPDTAIARFTGTVEDLIKGKGLAVTVTGKGRSIPEILKLFNITSVPELGPFDVTGKLTDLDGKLGVKDLDLNVGSPDTAIARFTGTVEDLIAIKGMNLSFDIQGKDLTGLEKITSQPLPFNGPFSVSGNAVVLSEKAYKISNLKALIQASDLNGSLEINLAAEKPWIAADLSSQKLDLRSLLPKKGSKAGEPEKDSDEPPARKDKVFPNTPLPLEGLPQVDAKIDLQAEQLLLPRLSLSDTTAHMVLEDGHLTVKPLKFVISDGTLDGSFGLHYQKKAAAVAMDFKIDQVDLGRMLGELGVNDVLEGKLDMDINLKGRGDSIAALMAGLNGNAMVVMGAGSINNKFIKFFGADLSSDFLQMLNPFKKKTQNTDVNCFVSGLEIKNGLAQSTALVLDTSQVSVVGYGKINLDTEELDLSLKPSPKKGTGIKGLGKFSLSFGELTKPLKLKGTLSNTSLSIDTTGTIFTIGKAVGGVALFGPVGILAALASGKFGNKNPCLAAIEAANSGVNKADGKKTEAKEDVSEKTTDGNGSGPKKSGIDTVN